MYKDRKRIDKNGYVVVEYPEHPKAFDTGTGIIGVYEHILVAERDVVDRELKPLEVVHHLDRNRSNNSPDNLLVLQSNMHGKLHSWIDKNIVIPKDGYAERTAVGCIRCVSCERPIRPEERFCSTECASSNRRKCPEISKDDLQRLVFEKPSTLIAKDFGVSDKAVEKLCKKLGVEKPGRGHWAKLRKQSA